jgi:hypothetical protein
LPSHHSFERCDPGFVFLEQVGRLHVIIQGSGFELADPDPDQLTRNVVALGQRWSVSPAMNSSATCRLNATLWERCLAMASILQKPRQRGVKYTNSNCPPAGAHSIRRVKFARRNTPLLEEPVANRPIARLRAEIESRKGQLLAAVQGVAKSSVTGGRSTLKHGKSPARSIGLACGLQLREQQANVAVAACDIEKKPRRSNTGRAESGEETPHILPILEVRSLTPVKSAVDFMISFPCEANGWSGSP